MQKKSNVGTAIFSTYRCVKKEVNNTEQRYYYPWQFPATVINDDNKLITGGVTGWIIWIYQIIEGTTNRTNIIS
nr:hypothetical protein [Clostridia bacterium]